ncbi:hypothetical protein ACWDSL_35675 [Streptomyces sp. NPDC000941]
MASAAHARGGRFATAVPGELRRTGFALSDLVKLFAQDSEGGKDGDGGGE